MHPIVYVSSLSWFEVYRYRYEDGSLMGDRLEADIAKHVIVEPFDVGVSERAARLFVKARSKWDLCPKCFAAVKSKTCKGCGSRIANDLKLFDSMIVAHAEQMGSITHLYSFDGGFLELGSAMLGFDDARKTLSVLEPPLSTGARAVNRRGRLVLAGTPEATVDPGDSTSMLAASIDAADEKPGPPF